MCEAQLTLCARVRSMPMDNMTVMLNILFLELITGRCLTSKKLTAFAASQKIKAHHKFEELMSYCVCNYEFERFDSPKFITHKK